MSYRRTAPVRWVARKITPSADTTNPVVNESIAVLATIRDRMREKIVNRFEPYCTAKFNYHSRVSHVAIAGVDCQLSGVVEEVHGEFEMIIEADIHASVWNDLRDFNRKEAMQ